MTGRFNPYVDTFDLVKPYIDFALTTQQTSGLEPTLMELVKVRASQINKCAFCLHMHTKEARRLGETEERLYMLDAWRESPLYSAREKAALAWTEALTRLSEVGFSEDAYESLWAQFTQEEQVKLTMMVVVINGFNRLGVGFQVGHPTPQTAAA